MFKSFIMDLDIIKLARECPGVILSIKVEDLVEANQQLIDRTKSELEQSIAQKGAVTYLTRAMVLSKLNIAPATLWRWGKSGYLVPVNIGGQRRYKSTDIDEILEGKR